MSRARRPTAADAPRRSSGPWLRLAWSPAVLVFVGLAGPRPAHAHARAWATGTPASSRPSGPCSASPTRRAIPSYTLLLWLASVVLQPFGDPAFRANLLSALLVVGRRAPCAPSPSSSSRAGQPRPRWRASLLAVAPIAWAQRRARRSPRAPPVPGRRCCWCCCSRGPHRERAGRAARRPLAGRRPPLVFGLSLGNHAPHPAAGARRRAVRAARRRRASCGAAGGWCWRASRARSSRTVAVYAYMPAALLDGPAARTTRCPHDRGEHGLPVPRARPAVPGTFRALPSLAEARPDASWDQRLGQPGHRRACAAGRRGSCSACFGTPRLIVLTGLWFAAHLDVRPGLRERGHRALLPGAAAGGGALGGARAGRPLGRRRGAVGSRARRGRRLGSVGGRGRARRRWSRRCCWFRCCAPVAAPVATTSTRRTTRRPRVARRHACGARPRTPWSSAGGATRRRCGTGAGSRAAGRTSPSSTTATSLDQGYGTAERGRSIGTSASGRSIVIRLDARPAAVRERVRARAASRASRRAEPRVARSVAASGERRMTALQCQPMRRGARSCQPRRRRTVRRHPASPCPRRPGRRAELLLPRPQRGREHRGARRGGARGAAPLADGSRSSASTTAAATAPGPSPTGWPRRTRTSCGSSITGQPGLRRCAPSGLRAARYPLVCFTDGDRQFRVADLGRLLERMSQPADSTGADARRGRRATASGAPTRPSGSAYARAYRWLPAAVLRAAGPRRRLRLQAVPARGARGRPARVRRRVPVGGAAHQARALAAAASSRWACPTTRATAGRASGANPRVVLRAVRDFWRAAAAAVGEPGAGARSRRAGRCERAG